MATSLLRRPSPVTDDDVIQLNRKLAPRIREAVTGAAPAG